MKFTNNRDVPCPPHFENQAARFRRAHRVASFPALRQKNPPARREFWETSGGGHRNDGQSSESESKRGAQTCGLLVTNDIDDWSVSPKMSTKVCPEKSEEELSFASASLPPAPSEPMRNLCSSACTFKQSQAKKNSEAITINTRIRTDSNILNFNFVDQPVKTRCSRASQRRQRDGGQAIAVAAACVGATPPPYNKGDDAGDK